MIVILSDRPEILKNGPGVPPPAPTSGPCCGKKKKKYDFVNGGIFGLGLFGLVYIYKILKQKSVKHGYQRLEDV